MRNLFVTTITVLCACIFISGCATMHYPRGYKVEGKEVRDFKELDDDKALKLVVLIYNVKPDTWEGGIARSIALQEYITLLAKRKSAYIKKSGIFEVSYDKVSLRAWKDEDLIKLAGNITPKIEAYYIDASPGLTETQNAERILYLTAFSAIDTEMKTRDNARNVLAIASQFIFGILMVALSIL